MSALNRDTHYTKRTAQQSTYHHSRRPEAVKPGTATPSNYHTANVYSLGHGTCAKPPAHNTEPSATKYGIPVERHRELNGSELAPAHACGSKLFMRTDMNTRARHGQQTHPGKWRGWVSASL